MKTRFFQDPYGCTASITDNCIEGYPDEFTLRVRDAHGTLYHEKAYRTYKGARIALGWQGDIWHETNGKEQCI